MNEFIRVALLAVAVALFAMSPASASPGAHGPNGEHLDGPAGTTSIGNVPRFEAKSEAFEMVGRLSGGELSMFINRYETNEPVNNAKVELELGNLKATAPFHEDQGDYAVADEAFLQALAKPGQHALVITLVAGKDSDLLEGTLLVPEQQPDDHGHAHGVNRLAVVGIAALLVFAGLAFAWRVRATKRARHSMQGVAQ